MFAKTLIPIFLLAAAFPATAQTPNPNPPDNGGQGQNQGETEDRQVGNRFWQASIGGGSYMVALDRIASVSRHEYLLDGAVIVDEVTIDTVGQALARFYFLRPVTDATRGSAAANVAGRAVDRARELAERSAGRAGVDVQNMVVKKYPETTHAKTIEFRVQSAGQLDALYKSVRDAWEKNRGRQLTIK